MSHFYIGPAQITATRAPLQIFGSSLSTDEKYCNIGRDVDVARLKGLATQNLLLLFYFLMLHARADQPLLAVWTAKENRISEGLHFQGIQRQPDGDVEISFSETKTGAPTYNTLLSDIRLVQVMSPAVPSYVLDRLLKQQAPPTEATAEEPGHDLKRTGRDQDMYLRHPRTGEGMFPSRHKEFYRYASGQREMPEPFTIEAAGLVSLGNKSPQAA